MNKEDLTLNGYYYRRNGLAVVQIVGFESVKNYRYVIFMTRVGIGKCRYRIGKNTYRLSMSAFINSFKPADILETMKRLDEELDRLG